ncbi:MAG: phosphotransferase [Bacteroidales bacterium]|jgi:aminoglycoside/choline kinase family phosphotransferase|nr:phosphotransferase [Bacteroidales bacterium]
MNFKQLFFAYANEPIEHIEPLPVSGGSYRRYYRINGKTKRCLGVENADKKENLAFVDYTRQFEALGLNVPKILAENLDENKYLIEDLGDETLYSYLTKYRIDRGFDEHLVELYKSAIKHLLEFQIKAGQHFDYTHAHPQAAFGKQSILWDLNYFKYYFLKLAKISFDEQALENDFETFSNFLLTVPSEYFMYRDFQSRNIMLHDGKLFFIDYQGGRKGALQYDLASLLYQAKAEIPYPIREQLLDFYIAELRNYQDVDEVLFKKQFYGFVFIRIMQTLGAYGFRGFYERKDYFLNSIPFAIDNIEYLFKNFDFPTETPVLKDVLMQITNSKNLRHQTLLSSNLVININSFSFKKGYLDDVSGNGGGFVFDCRGLPNPGRYEEYKTLNGKDEAVKKYLEQHDEVADFIDNSYRLVAPSIQNYISRNFEHLQINFGCTGGQHRSVYCAEKISKKILQNFNIQIIIKHREQN